MGAPPDTGQLATYIQRLRGYAFDASPILRKFLACGVPLTEDLVRPFTTLLSMKLCFALSLLRRVPPLVFVQLSE